MKEFKIAIIGAGSSYTPELIEGIIKRKDVLKITEIAMVDVETGREKLAITHSLAKRMIEKAHLNIKVSSTLDRRSALQGCSYVITQIRVGGLDAREKDERIPLKYGLIGQETTGAGGFAKALRTIPVILSIARDMEEICPRAFLINFTNPSGMVTEAVIKHSKIRCIGLCNVPINMERGISSHLGVSPGDIFCQFVGLNHLSWIKKVYINGEDRILPLLEEKIFQESIVKNISDVEGMGEISKKIGMIPSPYLGYYYFEQQRLKEELEELQSSEGTRAQQVKHIEKELFEIYSDPGLNEKPKQLEERGGALYSEVAIALIEGIHNNSNTIQVANVRNNGAISGLPDDYIVETNCLINSAGAFPITSGRIPELALPLVTTVKTYEQYTISAAVSGSRDDAFKALLCHPLIHGSQNAAALLQDIVESHKEYLPAFFTQGEKK